MLEILEIASAVPEPVEPVPVRVGAGGAVEVEPDMFEMKSAAEEHQRQCHKGARREAVSTPACVSVLARTYSVLPP